MLSLIQPIMWAKLLTYLIKYQLDNIFTVLVQLGSVMIGELLITYLTNYLYSYLNESIVFDLKSDMYSKLLDLPVRAFDKKGVGEFISRIHTDAGAVSQAITRQIVELIMNICKVVFIGIIVFSLNVVLGLIILVAFPLSSTSFLLFGRKLRTKNEERAKLSDKYFSDVQETIHGIREVKSLALKAERLKSFLQLSSNIRILNIKVQNISSIAQNFTQAINYISNLVVLCVGSYFTYSRTLSIENFIAFASYSTQFTDSLISVTQTQATVQQIMTSLERMFELMDNLNYTKEFQGDKKIECIKGKIE
ncbi:MAG TPA: ABC transporter ATP-binding protein, partial [Clostridia bacterium]